MGKYSLETVWQWKDGSVIMGHIYFVENLILVSRTRAFPLTTAYNSSVRVSDTFDFLGSHTHMHILLTQYIINKK